MKLYLANIPFLSSVTPRYDELARSSRYLLMSYQYLAPWMHGLLHDGPEIMMDSGAFTVLNGGHIDDLDRYTDRYIEFIRSKGIRQYLEMDVDSVLGVEKVRELRRRIEREVGWPSIPVWHACRGLDWVEEASSEYDYIAFGGMNTDGLSRQDLDSIIPWFIRTAHRNGCKVHGLGFTPQDLCQYAFDSVDSASWAYAGAYGKVVRFNGRSIVTLATPPPGHRGIYQATHEHNFREWVKFQDFLARRGGEHAE